MRGHVDPTARGILVRSRDGGRSWGGKVIVDDETWRFSQTEDVPVTQLSDGSLLLNLYSWTLAMLPNYFRAPSDPDAQQTRPWTPILDGLSFRRSTDNGQTWSPREPIRMPGVPALVARCPALELPNGDLLLATGYRPSLRVPERGSREYPYTAHVIRSGDKGKTWSKPALVAEDPHHDMHFIESGITRLRDGRIILMHRTENYFYQSDSTDDGRSFSKPRKTPMWGWVAYLMQLRDGRVLCIYGHRRPPFGVRATISRDGGRSWDIQNEIVIRADGGDGDLGYPSAIEFEDGRVLTVYWFNQEKPGVFTSETRYIAGTFFRP